MPRGANVVPIFPTLNREFAAGTRTTKGTETFLVEVPLIVAAGSYALHVEATSGTDSVSRDIPMRVR